MGSYLNPSSIRFKMSLDSEIYVDKTDMIMHLNAVINTNQRYACVSRPRRFGKTMAADMLCAYYGDSENQKLFEHTKLAKCSEWDRYLGKFNIIRIVMTDFLKPGRDTKTTLEIMVKRILEELKETYPDVKDEPDDLAYSMSKYFQTSGKQFVIVIDEWDSIFREQKEDKDGQRLYLDFLRDWLKDKEYVALAYMTGILPIKKYGKHSALNMFREFSVIAPMQLAKYTGFTEAEVKELCRQYHIPFEDISRWYNGYTVFPDIPIEMREKYRAGEYEDKSISIYSPLSVVEAVSSGIIMNYWNKTETYEALAQYIRMDYDGMKGAVALLMDGGRVPVDISTYQNDMTSFQSRDDVFTMLIHLGYLGYDVETREVFIPNREILDEFKTSTKSEEWTEAFTSFRKSQELLQATWDGEEGKVALLLEWFHDTAGNKTYNSEAALSYAIQMAYYAAQKYYTTILELDSGKGYADIVYLPSPKYPDKPALLVELKYDQSVQTAADQIRARNYPQRLEHYKGNLLLVCVNYDKEAGAHDDGYKHHSCSIEKA